MFNFVMGIIMIGTGVVSLVYAFFSNQMAGFIFFGMLMLGFGIVEVVRSKKMKAYKKAARDREFDMYTAIAAQMGVKLNPLTGEIISEKPETGDKAAEDKAAEDKTTEDEAAKDKTAENDAAEDEAEQSRYTPF